MDGNFHSSVQTDIGILEITESFQGAELEHFTKVSNVLYSRRRLKSNYNAHNETTFPLDDQVKGSGNNLALSFCQESIKAIHLDLCAVGSIACTY